MRLTEAIAYAAERGWHLEATGNPAGPREDKYEAWRVNKHGTGPVDGTIIGANTIQGIISEISGEHGDERDVRTVEQALDWAYRSGYFNAENATRAFARLLDGVGHLPDREVVKRDLDHYGDGLKLQRKGA